MEVNLDKTHIFGDLEKWGTIITETLSHQLYFDLHWLSCLMKTHLQNMAAKSSCLCLGWKLFILLTQWCGVIMNAALKQMHDK